MHTVRPLRSPAATLVDDVTFALCLAVIGAALAACVALATPDSVGSVQAATSGAGPQQAAATFTGAYMDGAPVYRLPAITVSASRTE
jgi:hypothetical protein